ncbi:MAG: peptidase M15A [Saprospiraceae bacterium]|nr:peptidase M15A [Candidatus Vicinibacter affinis]
MKLSENFSLEEMLASETAARMGISEQYEPSTLIIDNLKSLCQIILQPIREQIQTGIHISSGFRCNRLNTKVGGAKNSMHLFGMAADFIATDKYDVDQLFKFVAKGNLPFDQIIHEFGRWVHISYDPYLAIPRREILKAYKNKAGKTVYEFVKPNNI